MNKLLFFVLLAILAYVSAVSVRLSTTALPRKNLAGPPSEFSSKMIPLPESGAMDQQSAFFKISFNPSKVKAGSLCFSQSLQVDSTTSFGFSVFYPITQSVQLALYTPSSSPVDLSAAEYPGTFPIGDGGYSVPVFSYLFQNPEVGLWTLTGECDESLKNVDQEYDIIIILWNQANIKVYSRLSTYNTTAGNEIGLVATVYNADLDQKWREEKRAPSRVSRLLGNGSAVLQAEMMVTYPSGMSVSVPMHDDGLHGDALAFDGIYGALIKAAQVGTYEAEALIRGFTGTGVQFLRSSTHLLQVVPNNIKLSGAATGLANSDGTLTVYLDVDYSSTPYDESYYAFAQVWATSVSSGQLIPVAWIGGATDVLQVSNTNTLPLVMSQKWFDLANAKAPIVLKNVYIQNNLIAVSQIGQIDLPVTGVMKLGYRNVIEIDEEMYWGKRPAHLIKRKEAATGTLITVHGYCAANNPFEGNAKDFTNTLFFKDLSKSVTNDKFANDLAKFATDKGLSSFGLVAHSQGGAASLHLHNFYWSPLENAVGNRQIQTVGTPYAGSSLAGSSANLGKVFGIGCGGNYDLTHDGANQWQVGLTSQAKDDVFYYTTQYKSGGLVNYCNLGANMLLKWPNDGVTEVDYSQLSGAKSVGHDQAECHTAGMKWPPQCSNGVRDREMSKLASR